LNLGNLNPGNPDGYQKKGVAGEAKRIVVKRSGLARFEFEGAGTRKVFWEDKRGWTADFTSKGSM
jgi:hypothetical protein